MNKFSIAVLVAVLSVCRFVSYAQSKMEVGVRFGLAGNTWFRFQDIVGAGGTDGGLSLLAGVRVGYRATDRLMLVSGLEYGRHRLTVISASAPERTRTDGKITTLSLPLGVEWYIGRWFFIHGGPSIDIQPEKWERMDSQGGIGFSAGIGGHYTTEKWSFSLAPAVKQYALIPFGQEKYHQRLMTTGATVTVGYRF